MVPLRKSLGGLQMKTTAMPTSAPTVTTTGGSSTIIHESASSCKSTPSSTRTKSKHGMVALAEMDEMTRPCEEEATKRGHACREQCLHRRQKDLQQETPDNLHRCVCGPRPRDDATAQSNAATQLVEDWPKGLKTNLRRNLRHCTASFSSSSRLKGSREKVDQRSMRRAIFTESSRPKAV
eukprot:6208750-Pleurochrysis_carterae.AAC.3